MLKDMMHKKIWKVIIRHLTPLLVMSIFLSFAVVTYGVRAQEAAPEITVSCRVEPERVIVGQAGTLYVSVEDVPAETIPGYGMNAFDIRVDWTAGEVVTFNEASPRPGPEPWDADSTLTLPSYNKIEDVLGTLRSIRVLNSTPPQFSGSSVLFSTTFQANQAGTLAFGISEVRIPYYALEDILYRTVIENCSVTVLEGIAIYLPLIQR